eukprot:scaffold25948_cov32-Attheya_sp.AAC.1
MLWNSVISTKGAKYMTMDIKNFYLCCPLDRSEFMKMPITIFPQHIIDQYHLMDLVYKGYIWIEIKRSIIYGLPQAGKLACQRVPEAETSTTRILRGETHARPMETHNKTTNIYPNGRRFWDWDGALYCDITLDWNYEEGWVDISMPGYIKKVLQKYKHEAPTRPQNSPYHIQPKKYGIGAQDTIPTDETPSATSEEIKYVQGVVGSILFYARAIDMTFLVGLNTIATEQAAATQKQ